MSIKRRIYIKSSNNSDSIIAISFIPLNLYLIIESKVMFKIYIKENNEYFLRNKILNFFIADRYEPKPKKNKREE